jgi:hypothetical protein
LHHLVVAGATGDWRRAWRTAGIGVNRPGFPGGDFV